MFLFASIEFIFAAIAWKGFGEGLWQKLSLLMNDVNPAIEEEEAKEDESVTASDKSDELT